MGSLYGAMLSSLEENQVFLIDIFKEHVDKINEKGLQVEESGEIVSYKHLKAVLDSKEIGPADLAIIFVKSIFTEAAVLENQSIFDGNTIILTMQNGLGNLDIISRVTKSTKVLGGTTDHGAYLKAPGEICHASIGKTIIGEIDGSLSSRIKKISENFKASGIETEISENIQGIIWDKLIVNVAINPLTAITSLKNGDLLLYPELLDIMRDAVEETIEIAYAKGIKLSHQDPFKYVKEVCRASAANKSSMLQDILNGRNTEIDMINGAVVREGEERAIPTPVNKTLSELIRYLEKRERH